MITEGFTKEKGVVSPEDIYPCGRFFDTCLCIFSPAILKELLEKYPSREVAFCGSVKGPQPIYAVDIGEKTVGAFSLSVGSAIAGTEIIDINRVAGAEKFIVFGSAGALNSSAIAGRLVIPTAAYRDEGFSYHYAPPSDYIDLPDNEFTASVFRELGVPYVMGKTWTTDAFYRETRSKKEKRVEEGCLTVDMEMAGLAAACSFHGFKLYSFLQAGDVLDGEEYDISGLHEANHDIKKLRIAIGIARRL